MTAYITLGEGKNTKVIYTGSNTASTVTTCTAETAAALAAALEAIGSELSSLLCIPAAEPDSGTHDVTFDTARHLLNIYDSAVGQRELAWHPSWNAPARLLESLAGTVATAPAPVRNAVRTHLAAQLSSLHDPLVAAALHDGRDSVTFLLNPVLASLGTPRAAELLGRSDPAERDCHGIEEPVLQSQALAALAIGQSHLVDADEPGVTIGGLRSSVLQLEISAASSVRWARRNAPDRVEALTGLMLDAIEMQAPTRELRADGIKVGDRYREFGMGEQFQTVLEVDWHGDTILLTTDSSETAIDRDDVVEIVDRTWLKTHRPAAAQPA